MRKAFVALVIVAGLAAGADLIENGRFEDSTSAWALSVDSTSGSWLAVTAPDYDNDPDHEVMVWKFLQYHTRLSQVATLPSLQTRFSVDARLSALASSDTDYYAYASVTLEYQNAGGTALGRTMILRKTPLAPLANSATLHLIEPAGEDWHSYEFIVADELANLSGVNPAQVARLAVRLEACGTGVPG